MLLTIDNLAKRYGRLPSEVLAQANTFDLHVLDVSTKFQNHLHDREQGKTKGGQPSQQELIRMMQVARGEI
jgi:hypothetical protein